MLTRTSIARLGLACLVFAIGGAARAATVRVEAETCTEPKDGWQVDRFSEDHWNLWSTDKDAAKKWSGGVVLQSPVVKADRKTGAEGAPVLHTTVTGLPAGTYDVYMNGTRLLGLSLDAGQTWAASPGGLIARGVEIRDGRYEIWFDDRFLSTDAAGSCYVDYLEFRPHVDTPDGVANPGFEAVDGEKVANWTWWSREGGGAAVPVTTEKHGGERSVHVTHDGTRDYAFSNSGRLSVKPGGTYVIRGWVKCNAGSPTLATVAQANGKLVSWDIGSADALPKPDWQEVAAEARVPEGVDGIYLRWVGSGRLDAYLDDVSLAVGTLPARPLPSRPKVRGSAPERVREKLDRGLAAVPTAAGVYVGWRLLEGDPADLTFNVYRQAEGGQPVRVNAEPVRWTTDLLDREAPAQGPLTYTVRAVTPQGEGPVGGSATVSPGPEAKPYTTIPLQDTYTVQKAGLGDLDGDGHLDLVIKQPGDNIDPYDSYWKPSPGPYTLEAYRHDGTLLWRQDLGWGIERGIWYSPYLVYDLDGDGKAEVAAKIAPGDPRSPDGRVREGEEWLVVWDGASGKERARVAWPSRDGFGEGLSGYNFASRNQIAVAYLDGKTPCLLALRGTYTIMKVDAYELTAQGLRALWTYTTDDMGRAYRGQGAHFTHAADVDGDGLDEVMLGSVVLDDNGLPLWGTRLGHPDLCYVGDLIPDRPGLEAYFVIEPGRTANNACMADARTGDIIWGLKEPMKHGHIGACADLDAVHPGSECYAQDAPDHKASGDPWLWTATGEVLERKLDTSGARSGGVYWDADLQREILRGGKFTDFGGGPLAARTEGSIVLVADLAGDWREEVVTSVAGELRIYTTTIPATDRRVCLLQDPIYRLDVCMGAMAYYQVPTLSKALDATAPGLNLTAMRQDDAPVCQIVVSAPLDREVRGTLQVTADGATADPATTAVVVAPGQVSVTVVALRGPAGGPPPPVVSVRAEVAGLDRPLRGEVTVRAPTPPLRDVPMAQAETLSGQGGGEVHIRDDKRGVTGKAISHWDAAGHWLEWTLELPADGTWNLVCRYSCPAAAGRALSVNGQPQPPQTFASSGGFGDNADEWADHTAVDAAGKPLALALPKGSHVLRLENSDGKGLNLDYLALVPAR